MQLLLKAQLAVWLFVATVWARELHGGTTVDWGTQYVGNGDVHIFSGAIWSIINNAASDFHGNIRVDSNAGLYVSSVSPNIALSATLMDMIYGFVNNGVV
ncbi:alanine transaminase, partial [Candida orthopsilosis Co 90-125]